MNSPDTESSLISSPGGGEGGMMILVMKKTGVQGIAGDESGVDSTVNEETLVGGLMTLKNGLDDQSLNVTDLINLFGGEVINREDQLVQLIERLRSELENERQKKFELEMELDFFKIQISSASNTDENV